MPHSDRLLYYSFFVYSVLPPRKTEFGKNRIKPDSSLSSKSTHSRGLGCSWYIIVGQLLVELALSNFKFQMEIQSIEWQRRLLRVLGEPDGEDAEIKRAYAHYGKAPPTRTPVSAPSEVKECAESTPCCDAQKRGQYDRLGCEWVRRIRSRLSNIEDIFDLFGFGDMFAGAPESLSGAVVGLR